MTYLRQFIRQFPRFKQEAEGGKVVVLTDRQGRRFLFQAERPKRLLGSASRLAKGKPLSPEPVPKSEWKGNY
jgi:hypothetical protein